MTRNEVSPKLNAFSLCTDYLWSFRVCCSPPYTKDFTNWNPRFFSIKNESLRSRSRKWTKMLMSSLYSSVISSTIERTKFSKFCSSERPEHEIHLIVFWDNACMFELPLFFFDAATYKLKLKVLFKHFRHKFIQQAEYVGCYD